MPDYGKNFAYNMKRLRKAAGYTQKRLAAAAGCSEKAVSKWESGASVPYIDTLFLLAQLFHTGIENLFVDASPVYYLGIDGGGTKTALKLTAEDGTVLRTWQAPACNPYDIGMDKAQKILRHAIYEICGDTPLSSIVMFAGIAGGTAGENRGQLASFFDMFHFLRAANGSDNDNLIEAGLHGSDGITLLMGTGVCLFTVKGGEKRRMAGWGYLFDNGGSAYDLGRDAIHAAYGDFDGSAEKTLLRTLLEEAENGTMDELLGGFYKGGKRKIASYAPLVFEAADAGDRIAEEIITRNVGVAAGLLDAAAEQFPNGAEIPVVIAGGVTKEQTLLPRLNSQLTDKRLRVQILDTEPVDGAVLLARRIYPPRTEA